MRTIIAGSRTCNDMSVVRDAIAFSDITPSLILCGGARGVDRLGAVWARDNDISVMYYLADWARFGMGAGKIRNVEMALNADALIAVWDGTSPGTGHMIDTARAKGLKIHVELF